MHYRVYAKPFFATEKFDIQEGRIRVCNWLVDAVAPAFPFLLPEDPDLRRNAVLNLYTLPAKELVYMAALLQEKGAAPAFPQRPTTRFVPRPYDTPPRNTLGIENRVPWYVAVVPSHQKGAGLGVVNCCATIIPANEALGWYFGDVVAVREGRRRAVDDDNVYILLVGNDPDHDYAIDAKDRTTSTWTRFINEARGATKSNVMFDERDFAMVDVTTTLPVPPGHEVLLSYVTLP